MERRILILAMGALMVGTPFAVHTQTPQPASPATDDAAKNAAQARAVLDAMVKAMGGDAWLNIQNRERQGHVSTFFQGNPNPATTEYFSFHQWPDHDRTEYTKHRDVVQFLVGDHGWEVTYRGKKAWDKDTLDEAIRDREHSIEIAVKVWMKEPNTMLIYEGQHLAERHLAEQVTLISPQNDAITILVDAQTHLPLRRVFQWRDQTYHDKNTEAEDYANYHTVDGLPTPFMISRSKNGDMVRQYFVDRVRYNQTLSPDFWDVDAAERRIKK